MSLKLLATSDDILIFGEMQDKHHQPFTVVCVRVKRVQNQG